MRRRAAAVMGSAILLVTTAGHAIAAAPRQLTGVLAQADASHGPRYLAVPWGPGVLTRVTCGAGSIELLSTDAGPVLSLQRQGRIGDLAVGLWVQITGLPASAGIARGCTVTRLAGIRPPATDTAP